MTDSASAHIEWQLLTSFQAHRHRLVDSMVYMPLDTAAAEAPPAQTDLQNKSEFLEDALRQILRRDDARHCLTARRGSTLTKAVALLQTLWTVLEGMVNVDLLRRSSNSFESFRGEQQYPKLHTLLVVLGDSTDWGFDMVSGTSAALFRSLDINVIETAKRAATEFNAFLDRQAMSSVRDVSGPSVSGRSQVEETDVPSDEAVISLLQEAVRTLFSHFKAQPYCEKAHQVLIQLQDLEGVTLTIGDPTEPELELFLSSCRRGSRGTSKLRWKNSLLSSYSLKELGSQWRKTPNLCDEIHSSEREALSLAASEQQIHIYEDRVNHSVATKRPTWRKKPTKTLKQLMRDRAFRGDFFPLRSSDPFTSNEKRELAAKLVSSFFAFYWSGFIVQSWDPESVYFLAESQRNQCLRTHPFAMLVEQLTIPLSGVPSEPPNDLKAERLTFLQLAKLLLEIKYGEELTNVELEEEEEDDDDDDDDDNDHKGRSLRDAIIEAMSQDVNDKAYLTAVEDCSKFRYRYRYNLDSFERQHPGVAVAVAETAARRQTCNEIIQGLRSLSTPNPTEPSKVWDMAADTLQISSASGQLGQVDPVYQAPLVHDATVSPQSLPIPPSIQVTPATRPRVSFADDRTVPLASVGGLFDDMPGNQEHIKYDRFFSQIEIFKEESEQFIARKATMSIKSRPVRIAILDTGVDKSHSAIKAGFMLGNLSEASCMSWVSSEDGVKGSDAVLDTDGHGTNTTDLLLRVAPPESQIFVAKVFEGRDLSLPEVANISKAIHHVVHNWGADVVTMSFGLKRPRVMVGLDKIWSEIENAIAGAQNTVFLAAAGNDGPSSPRGFPASISKDVICVHASDGNGVDGGISPQPQYKGNDFMTLGMNIRFNLRLNGKETTVYRSGTSYATPIAAGMVAILLPVLKAMDLDKRSRDRAHTSEGMKEIFRLMCTTDKYSFVAPAVKLWEPNWHRDERRIHAIECMINDALP